MANLAQIQGYDPENPVRLTAMKLNLKFLDFVNYLCRELRLELTSEAWFDSRALLKGLGALLTAQGWMQAAWRDGSARRAGDPSVAAAAAELTGVLADMSAMSVAERMQRVADCTKRIFRFPPGFSPVVMVVHPGDPAYPDYPRGLLYAFEQPDPAVSGLRVTAEIVPPPNFMPSKAAREEFVRAHRGALPTTNLLGTMFVVIPGSASRPPSLGQLYSTRMVDGAYLCSEVLPVDYDPIARMVLGMSALTASPGYYGPLLGDDGIAYQWAVPPGGGAICLVAPPGVVTSHAGIARLRLPSGAAAPAAPGRREAPLAYYQHIARGGPDVDSSAHPAADVSP